jgi:hypothetical protein
MRKVNAALNRLLTRPFVVNSLPKAGTHLVQKAVALFPGIRWEGLHIGRSHRNRFGGPEGLEAKEARVPIGVDWPQLVQRSVVREALGRLKAGQFATAHLPYSAEMSGLLAELRIRSVLIVRDPRDVVVSHANHVPRSPHHFLYEHYTSLSPADQILASIEGVELAENGGPRMLNICERYRSVLGWMREPNNCTTQFEKLVGPQAGGSQADQMEELEKITRHLGIRYDPGELTGIAQNVYGGTSTFRKGLKGQIGDWRRHLTAEHCSAFKRVAGQLLIELGYERDLDW